MNGLRLIIFVLQNELAVRLHHNFILAILVKAPLCIASTSGLLLWSLITLARIYFWLWLLHILVFFLALSNVDLDALVLLFLKLTLLLLFTIDDGPDLVPTDDL